MLHQYYNTNYIKILLTLFVLQVLSTRCCNIFLHGFGEIADINSNLEECRRLGAKQAVHHGANLSDPNQIEDLFNYVKEKCGQSPDILVNNAG